MTTDKGGGTHPGDPWSPDWQPATTEDAPEEDWPYDESLTLSDAEIEIADIEDEEDLDAEAEDVEDVEDVEAVEAVDEPTAAEAEEAAAAREAEEAAAREAEAAAAREAEEAAAREAEEAAAREAEEAAAREAEEAAAREAEQAAREAEQAAREAEQAAREAEEAAAREAEQAAREAEEAAAREAEQAAREAEEAAAREAEQPAPEAGLRAVADHGEEPEGGIDVSDEVIELPIEEVAVEDLQAEPEWLEAVEEMTLDDIADAGDLAAEGKATMAVVPTDQPEAETPTEVIESIVEPAAADEAEEVAAVVIEDATFEVIDLDDAELRADTAEHLFEALEFEDVDHDEITAEVPATAEPPPPPETPAVEPLPEPIIEFQVPAEYDVVASNVDETRDALAAFMTPSPGEEAIDEAGSTDTGIESPEASEVAGDTAAEEMPQQDAEAEMQLRIPTTEAGAPAGAVELPEAAQPVESAEPTPEEMLIAQLSGDLTLPDFETFVQEDFSRGFAPEPTQEHKGLAEAISTAAAPEPSAVAASMPGVDHGHVGFQEFEEDLHFDDPDAADLEETAPVDETTEVAEAYSSDLTLRVASAVILVALLATTLWAGGVVFLVFIAIVALTAQIEFYAALRAGGYRPLVLFGLLGGIGALVGTYAQGSDVLTEGPIAVAAALGLTVMATFAWYGAQDHPPSDPWRNGVVTILGVAWIPALLALVLPMAAAARSDRLQIIIVLLIIVAAFDIGSYFVGRALGRRKLSPVLSPNKTVEGLIGGVIATVIVSLLAGVLVSVFDAGSALALAAAVILAAPLGDLAESLMKRSLGIKDMGQLIPGHGGVLDRIDSYLFAVPIAYFVLRWTGLL